MTNVKKVDGRLLIPVFIGFFITGFSDIVAPITKMISTEFPEEQQRMVNFLPTMVFLWFLLLATPTAGLMNRIGRKATSMIGYAFTFTGLMIPYIAGEGAGLVWYFIGFGLLGMGNTAVQVSVNPLLASIVPSETMTSHLTVGQVFRNAAVLLLAPAVTALIAITGSWRLLLPIYAGFTVIGGIWLQMTTVHEPMRADRSVGMIDCFKLLGNPVVAICAGGIACFIATDVGIGFLSGRLIDHPNSILTSTGFYACRIIGTIVGAYVLIKVSDVKYLRWNMLLSFVTACALFFVRGDVAIYALIGVLGFALSCIFSTFYAVATKNAPGKSNEVAGLMIMSISAGAISGPAVGAIIRATGDVHYGLLFIVPCTAYLLWGACNVKTAD